MAIRDKSYFTRSSFSATRYGLSLQYNYYRLGFFYGNDAVNLDTELRHEFHFLKLFAQDAAGARLKIQAQFISRKLVDLQADAAPIRYDGATQTFAVQTDWSLTYRWTLYVLTSLERQEAAATARLDGADDRVSTAYPKLFTGVTVTF
jgi:hypothetical protein